MKYERKGIAEANYQNYNGIRYMSMIRGSLLMYGELLILLTRR